MINFIIFFIICFYIIIDVFTGFFISSFLIHLIKVIPIFISDLFKIDWKVFRGYGFWAYSGLGGSGKTLSIVERLIKLRNRYPDLLILTNFNCSVSDGQINDWRDLLEASNYRIFSISEKEWLKFQKYNIYKNSDLWLEVDLDEMELNFIVRKNCGVVYGFDEIHLTFESTNWQDAPSNLLDYISQQRKLHKQILASSQVFTRIDKKLREQTNFVIECKSLFMGRLIIQKKYITQEYIANDEKMDKGTRKRKVKKRSVFIAYDYIRNSYDTHQIMKELKKGKSQESQLKDLIGKVIEVD